MKNYYLKLSVVILISLITTSKILCQISFVNKIFDGEDGIYGLGGLEGIAMSNDRKNIYTTAQYSMSVFSYDSVSNLLTFLKSYRDNDDGFNGLYGATSVIVSKDNKNVYVTSESENCLTVCSRDQITGLLSLQRIIYDVNLSGAHALVVSDDDKFLYVSASYSEKVSVFGRDTLTGDLTLLQSIPGTDLSRIQNLKLSVDNNFIYVTSFLDDAIGVFQRNSSTGLLTWVQTVIGGINGVQGIYSVKALDVTHDNKFLYAVGSISLAVFSRNIATGILTYVTSYTNNSGGVTGINGNYSIVIPPDDKSVYTVSYNDSALTTFVRNPINGQLSYLNTIKVNVHWLGLGVYSTTCLIAKNDELFLTSYWGSTLFTYSRNNVTSELTFHASYYSGQGVTIDGLSGANNAALSYDNKSLYVTTQYDGVSIFSVNDTSGKLSFNGVVKENGNIAGLTGANSALVTPDGKYVYIASQVDDAIVVFQRDTINYSLTYIQTIYNNQNGINGLNGANSIIMSPDFNYIYVGSTNDFGVAGFRYNSVNGALTFVNFIGLDSIFNFTIDIECIRMSPDGAYIFASSNGYNALYMFKRNATNGILSFLGRYTNFNIGGNYLYTIKSLDISKDSKNIYVIFNTSDYILNYSINHVDDSLYLVQSINSDIDHVETTRNPVQISVSNDNRFVYVSSLDSSAVNIFQRNMYNGKLSFVRAFRENQNNFDGLDGISSIIFSRNNKNVFLTSNIECGVSSYNQNLFLGNDIFACKGDTITLDPVTSYSSYLWSSGESNSHIKVTVNGEYTLTVTDEFGTIEVDTIAVYFYDLPVVSLGSDTSVCSNSHITLSPGNSFANYVWNTGETLQNINVATGGNFIVTVTDVHGCKNSDTVHVTALPVSIVNLGPDTAICNNAAFYLNSNIQDVDYLWNTGAVTQGISIISQGIYAVTITNNYHCVDADSINVQVHQAPVINLGPDTAICSNIIYHLYANASGNHYLWNTGATTSGINVSAQGVYSVTVTNYYNCVDSDSVHVLVYQAPVINLGPDTTINTNQTITLGLNGYSQYIWSTGSVSPSITIDTSDFVLDSLIVWVRVIDNHHCSSTDTVVVYKPSNESIDKYFINPGIWVSQNNSEHFIEIISNDPIKQFKLYSQTGSIIYYSRLVANDFKLDIGLLNTGVYLLEVETEKSIFYKKVPIIIHN